MEFSIIKRNSWFELRERLLLFVRIALVRLFGGEQCLCCGAPSGIVPVCDKCVERELFTLVPPAQRCRVCGKILVSEQDVCMACRESPLLVHADGVFPLYSYRLWKKELLFEWKIQEKRALTPLFAESVYRALCLLRAQGVLGDCIPVIVPVPPRPGKIRLRGWDQIDDVCLYLSKRYGCIIYPRLERITSRQQKKLDRAQRLQMKGKSYVLREFVPAVWKERPVPREVVLFDDVLTTGVTVESCAALLKEAGVAKVTILTLFIVD